MQIKRRFSGVFFVLLVLIIFTVLFKLSPYEYSNRSRLNKHRNSHDVSTDSNLKLRKHIELLKSFMNLIERLTNDLQMLKRNFVRNTNDLTTTVQRKDIYIDVLNNGDQTQCRNVTLLIMISSHITHSDRRNTVRQTWGNQNIWKEYAKKQNFTFGLLFLVGKDDKNETLTQETIKESNKYGDLLIERLEESFYSLSYKVMIGFQWVIDQCSFTYLLKGDDDIFVDIYNTINFLKSSYIPRKDLYVGHMMTVSEVMRNGRYGVSRDEYIRDYYPRYCSGGGFFLTRDVISRMIPHYNWINPLKIDDAYMGQLVLKAGVDAWHDDRFRMYEDDCKQYNDTLVMHAWRNRAIEETCAKNLNLYSLSRTLKNNYKETLKKSKNISKVVVTK